MNCLTQIKISAQQTSLRGDHRTSSSDNFRVLYCTGARLISSPLDRLIDRTTAPTRAESNRIAAS